MGFIYVVILQVQRRHAMVQFIYGHREMALQSQSGRAETSTTSVLKVHCSNYECHFLMLLMIFYQFLVVLVLKLEAL